MPSEEVEDIRPEERREWRIKKSIKVGYIALAFWPFLLFAALMSGDAPGSEKASMNLFMWVLYAGAVPFATHVVARIAFDRGQYKIANCIALLPTLMIGVLLAGAIVWSIVMDLLLKFH
jgi:hypothetical protein